MSKKETPLPRISVITPSHNQAAYLKQTIESVFSQDYPDLEYVVIDLGSTDGSIPIIGSYAGRLDYCACERGRSLSDAINVGFERATGQALCWLCAGDYLEPGALRFVGGYFADHPRCNWLVGQCQLVYPDGSLAEQLMARYGTREDLLRFWEATEGGTFIPQPSSFWRRKEVGELRLRKDLNYAMDYDLWLRLAQGHVPFIVPEALTNQRLPDRSRTPLSRRRALREQICIARPHWRERGGAFRRKCEKDFRVYRGNSLFGDAFQHKREGRRPEARRDLARAVAACPSMLCQWRFVNLAARLTAGDRVVDGVRSALHLFRSR